MFVSAHAASQKPSRLGLAVGQSISIDNAIAVVAVKSANDIAVALAEKLGGSEPNFVTMMNAKAAQLGMRNTHYANASGLTDPTNVTTARDLTILALALIHNHPRFYRYFGERDFIWQRQDLINHNHLLGKMVGLDGIKTGYTLDSGFTLAASAQRGDRRLIAVVLGEPSLVVRNRDASALLEAGFSLLDRRMLGQQETVASMLPALNHSALRIEPAIEQGASDEASVAPGPILPRAAMRQHRVVQPHQEDRHRESRPRASRQTCFGAWTEGQGQGRAQTRGAPQDPSLRSAGGEAPRLAHRFRCPPGKRAMFAERLPDTRTLLRIAAVAAGVGAVVAGATLFLTAAPIVPRAPVRAAIPALPIWSPTALRQLLHVVESSREEGLHPADYRRDTLATLVREAAHGRAVDALAEGAARSLAHDYAGGRVARRKRVDWHVAPPVALATLDADLDAAVRSDRVDAYLHALLPSDARYVALRTALRDAPPQDAPHIRASMERWRWMPRTLGSDYVFVNVPSYRVALYRGDSIVTQHDVVVGAPATPTPLLNASIQSIVINPWWTLPPTVLREGKGKRYSSARGFVYQTIGGKAFVRQKPGPMNALGRVKINMPNPYAIYLHDTPAKWGFAKTDRALSHGCIRVKDIADFAARIGDTAAVDTALGGTATQTLHVGRTLPVYIVYFTAAPDADGTVTHAARSLRPRFGSRRRARRRGAQGADSVADWLRLRVRDRKRTKSGINDEPCYHAFRSSANSRNHICL